MKNNKQQRIRLQLVSNPVKLDATILEMSHDGRELTVRFDGPLDDTKLYVRGDSVLIDKRLDDSDSLSRHDDIRIFKVVG